MRKIKYAQDLPKISCLMLTYDRDGTGNTHWRNNTFLQSYGAFIRQLYPKDKLELVVVNSGSDAHKEAVRKWVDPDPNLIKIEYSWKILDVDKQSIGNLRNIGLKECTGDLIATWDDDDVSDPKRLMTQLNYMTSHKVDACMFQNFDVRMYTEDFYDFEKRKGFLYFGLDGTLCFANPRGDVQYPNMNVSEDTAFIDLLSDNGYKVCAFRTDSPLFTYSYHGSNTMSKQHFLSMIAK